MTRKNRNALLWLLILFCLVFAGLAGLFAKRTEAFALEEAQEQALNLLLTQRAVHAYVANVQRPEIYRLQREGRLPEDYFSPALMSRTFVARNVMDWLNAERVARGLPPIYIKLASDNPRNPVNQADEWESGVLRQFNAGHRDEIRQVVERAGESWLFMAIPVQSNSAGCLKCHGNPGDAPGDLLNRYGDKAGFNEEIGRTRAFISLRIPLSAIIQEGRGQALGTLMVTFLSLAAVYLLIALFIRRLDEKHAIILRQNEELGRLSVTDPLTGLLNRAGFLGQLEGRVREAERYQVPLVLVMLDIDHFKSINDRYGHAVGDDVLRHVADILSRNLRRADLCCRWGGEEFLILLPMQDTAGGRASAEKLRLAVEQGAYPEKGRMTASFGVAVHRRSEETSEWIGRADRALYEAKASGRNRVVLAEDV
ncbi:MAG: diguanylate cyclase [Pseudomonadota bacterium]